MQRNSKPMIWRAKGLSDTEDASETFNGAMASLQNLIPDPQSARIWYCRPAATLIVNLNSTANQAAFLAAYGSTLYSSSGFISIMLTVGDVVYVMIAGGKGFDLPFAYNLATATLVLPTGVTTLNVPASPATSGTWTPPTMSLIGAKLVVTHPGFNGAGGVFFGYFDITNPAAPVWHGTNLTGAYSFTTVPSAVAQFYNRAYFITNVPAQPAVVFSDVLNATNVTNANQILTFGDNETLTALAGLPLANQLGGIIQSLMVFKDDSNIWQVTGDAALGTLAQNTLNIATGTMAPQSVVPTPKGLAFIASDGLRLIDFTARVSDPIGFDGNGITSPFSQSVVPSRISASCNGSLYRVTTQNGALTGSPTFEYWYDLARQIWSGPHTSTMNQIQPWRGTFVCAPTWATGALYESDPIQNNTSSFTENGTALSWVYQTPLMPDADQMTMNAMVEALLDYGFAAGSSSVMVIAQDANGTILDTVTISSTGGATIWGAFTWGSALWAGANLALNPQELPWTQPMVFARVQFKATGTSGQSVRLGAWRLRYQILRMFTNLGAVA